MHQPSFAIESYEPVASGTTPQKLMPKDLNRKILSQKLNTMSTVHTDISGLKSKWSATKDVTHLQGPWKPISHGAGWPHPDGSNATTEQETVQKPLGYFSPQPEALKLTPDTKAHLAHKHPFTKNNTSLKLEAQVPLNATPLTLPTALLQNPLPRGLITPQIDRSGSQAGAPNFDLAGTSFDTSIPKNFITPNNQIKRAYSRKLNSSNLGHPNQNNAINSTFGAGTEELVLDTQAQDQQLIQRARERIHKSVRRESWHQGDIDQNLKAENVAQVSGFARQRKLGQKRFSIQPSSQHKIDAYV